MPLPPPYAGPEISSRLLLQSSLKDEYHLLRLKLNVHRSNDQKGSISVIAVLRLVGLLLRLNYLLVTKRPFCLYTTLNQNVSGFLRDSMVALVAKAFRTKLTLHFRGSNFVAFYNRQGRLRQKYIRYVLNRADRIILQAHWLKDKFRYYVPESKLCVIYNGVAVRNFASVRRERPADKGRTNVLFLNHLSVAKGLVDLLTTAKRIVRQRDDIHFFVAGDVINEEKNILSTDNGRRVEFVDVSQMIDELKRDERYNTQIHILGQISDEGEKLRLLDQSDIFVLPSYSEGFPLSVLEAMAAGLPVIVTPVGALTEIITEGLNGFFVKVSDACGLERQIRRLSDNPSLARAMGERNRALVRSRFDIETIARQFSDVFSALESSGVAGR